MVDFTADNTQDGDKDYAALYINTTAGPRAFRVSRAETTWGGTTFTASRNAPYEHQVYHFAIPIAEIGIDPASAASLQVAFEAYGTASTNGQLSPELVFNSKLRDCQTIID